MQLQPWKWDIITLVLFIAVFIGAAVYAVETGCTEGDCQDSYTERPDDESLWDVWSTWSSCSVTCGTGVRVRSRSCLALGSGLVCEGPMHTEEPCFLKHCPNDKAGKPKTGTKSEEAFDGDTGENTAEDQEHTRSGQTDGNHDDLHGDVDDDGPMNDNDVDVDDDIHADDADDLHGANAEDDFHDNEQGEADDGERIAGECDADPTQDDPTLAPEPDGDVDDDDTINDGPQGQDDTNQEKSEDTKPSSDGQDNNSFEDDDGHHDDADEDAADDADDFDDDDQNDEDEEGTRNERKRRHASTASDKGDVDEEDEVSADDEPGGESGNDEDDERDGEEDDEDETGGKKKRKRPRPEDEEDEEEEDKDEEEEEEEKKKKKRRRRKKKKKRKKKKAKNNPEGEDEDRQSAAGEDVISAENCAVLQSGTSSSKGNSSECLMPNASPNYAVSQSSVESARSTVSQTPSYTSGDVETEDSSDSSSWSTGDESDTSESYTTDSSEDYTYSFSDSVFSSGFSSPISPPGSPSDDPCADAAEHLARLCQLSKDGRASSPQGAADDHAEDLSQIQSSCFAERDTGIGASNFLAEEDLADTISKDSSPVRNSPQFSMSSPVSPVERVSSPGSEHSGPSSTSSLEHLSIITCPKKRLQSTFIEDRDLDSIPSEKPIEDTHCDSGISDRNATGDLEVIGLSEASKK